MDSFIADSLGPGPRRVLDVACGIATQSVGLAALGHQVTGSDVSPGAVERARREASARGLTLELAVGDMRQVHAQHGSGFDVVLCADNSLLHLLDDQQIRAALREFLACARADGICVITMRDLWSRGAWQNPGEAVRYAA